MRSCKRFVPAGLVLATILPFTAQSQTITCGDAVSLLANYATEVNAFTNAEYYQNIPMRCGYNVNCNQYWYSNLGAWYSEQVGFVNTVYTDIVRQCTSAPASQRQVTARRQTDNAPGRIEQSSVRNLRIDDEDKTVRIKIPETPAGYR